MLVVETRLLLLEFVLESELVEKISPYLDKDSLHDSNIERHIQYVRNDLSERIVEMRKLTLGDRTMDQVLDGPQPYRFDPLGSFRSLRSNDVRFEECTIRTLLEQHPMPFIE